MLVSYFYLNQRVKSCDIQQIMIYSLMVTHIVSIANRNFLIEMMNVGRISNWSGSDGMKSW